MLYHIGFTVEAAARTGLTEVWSTIRIQARDTESVYKYILAGEYGNMSSSSSTGFNEVVSQSVMELVDAYVRFSVRRGFSTYHVDALRGVNFGIGKGEIVALIGESGSGKTTLGRVLVGLQPLTSGKVLYKGREVSKLKGKSYWEYRRSVQMIQQDPYTALNPSHRVADSLTAPMMRWKLVNSKSEALRRAERLLETVGLTPGSEYLNKYPHQLSGGQKQRVNIARAVSVEPELIVLDEPVTMIDVSLRIGILDLLLELRGRLGTSYVFTTHDLALARYFLEKGGGGRVVVMYAGSVVEEGEGRDIIRSPLHPYTATLLRVSAGLRPTPAAEDNRGRRPGPSWCRFAPRCPYAVERCWVEEPRLRVVSHSHRAACHLAGTLDLRIQ
jgi:oligopeptide/dipeptide ABC transporter ATP-binding protein